VGFSNGGTLVCGSADRAAQETGMPVFSAESPLTPVTIGSGEAVAHFDRLSIGRRHRRASIPADWRSSEQRSRSL